MPPRKGRKGVKKILETVNGKEDITQDPLNSSRSKNSKTGVSGVDQSQDMGESSFAFEEVKREGN
jgi:hypothetical protein